MTNCSAETVRKNGQKHYKASCQIAQISDARRAATTGDDVAVRVHGVFPPPMGMEWKGRTGVSERV